MFKLRCTDEFLAIESHAQDLSVAFTVFLFDNPNISALGLMCGPRTIFVFVDRHTSGNVNTAIAHELGHAQGLSHPDENGDPDPENLMHSNNQSVSKLRWTRQ